jgi:sugar phosphate isomerase/epimerase
MYTLRTKMTNEKEVGQTLKKVSDIGYKNIQISVPPFMDVKTLKSMLDDDGLKADSVLAPVGEIKEKIKSITKEGAILETDIARTTSMPLEQSYTIDGFKEFCASMNKEAKLICENGFRKCFYHFHAFEFIKLGDTRGIDIMLEEFDPEYVIFQPDIFWLTCAGTEPSASLKMFDGIAEYMHVKDYVIAPRTGILESVSRAFAPVGTGNLNWDGIIKTAKDIGIHSYVVEQDAFVGGEEPFESVKKSFDYLVDMGLTP